MPSPRRAARALRRAFWSNWKLQLTLMADNPRAQTLYERHGYALYAKEPDSVRRGDGSYVDEALMWKRL